MFKLLEFLKNLFYKSKPVYYVRDMNFISSTVDKDGVEKIIHGNDKAKVILTIKKGDGEGSATIVADKNVHIEEDDIVWLLKKYL